MEQKTQQEQDLFKFFLEQVADVEKVGPTKGKLEDMVEGLLQVIDLSTDYLPLAVANVYRSHSDTNSGRGGGREFLSPEVVYLLGKVNGVMHYYYEGMFYFYKGEQDPTKIVPTLKVICKEDVKGDSINIILKHLSTHLNLNQEREIHTGGFFIFRYFVKLENQRKQLYVPIYAGSPTKAVNVFRSRSDRRYSIEHAENIEVYSYGKWMHLQKMPPTGDILSSTSGRPLTVLAISDETTQA